MIMQQRIRIVSVDPWIPAIDCTCDRLPYLIGGHARANLRVEPRWTEGEFCKLVDEEPLRICIYSADESTRSGHSLKEVVDLVDGVTVAIGIRAFRFEVSPVRLAPLSREKVVAPG